MELCLLFETRDDASVIALPRAHNNQWRQGKRKITFFAPNTTPNFNP